jgi:hypothetical protein
MNNLFLFEAELKKARGHHLDHLIETSIFFKKKKITWITNKNFKYNKYFIHSNVKILKKINAESINFDSKYSMILKNLFPKTYHTALDRGKKMSLDKLKIIFEKIFNFDNNF